MVGKKRLGLRLFLGLLIVVVASPFIYFRFVEDSSVYDDEPFVQAVWLANPDPKPDDLVRARMVDSIIKTLNKPRTKDEVTRLLGDAQGPMERIDEKPGFMLTYHLGTYSDKYKDMGILVIDFGTDGISEGAWHLQSEAPTIADLFR